VRERQSLWIVAHRVFWDPRRVEGLFAVFMWTPQVSLLVGWMVMRLIAPPDTHSHARSGHNKRRAPA
jgi:hypothetical protein